MIRISRSIFAAVVVELCSYLLAPGRRRVWRGCAVGDVQWARATARWRRASYPVNHDLSSARLTCTHSYWLFRKALELADLVENWDIYCRNSSSDNSDSVLLRKMFTPHRGTRAAHLWISITSSAIMRPILPAPALVPPGMPGTVCRARFPEPESKSTTSGSVHRSTRCQREE